MNLKRQQQQQNWPSPCLSVNWKAWTKRKVSSTERPTGRSLMVICLRMPLLSMMNRPLITEEKTSVFLQLSRKDHDALAWCTSGPSAAKSPPVGDAFVLLQHAVICGDGAPYVGHKGDLHRTQTALFFRCVGPLRTHRNSQHRVNEHNHGGRYNEGHFLGYQAKWEKWESTEAAMTSQSIFLNSSAASLKAMISVGHTKVKSSG